LYYTLSVHRHGRLETGAGTGDHGNALSASLPIALDHAVREGQVASGDLILLGTFGGGLTWGAGLVRC
jgi:3-oxoacyl-[acyl-carrier-protein] synthase III